MTADIARRLSADRQATVARVAALERDLAVLFEATADAPDDEHDPEGATIGFERAQVSSLLDLARRDLAELDAADERLRSGVYGRCERCGTAIAAERLAAIPSARQCIRCASAG